MFLFVTIYLDDGHLAAEHHDDAHLEDDAEGVTDVVGIELLEALGTVSALEEEGISHGGLGEVLLECPGLAGEDDGREGVEGAEDGLEILLVGVFGQLQGLLGLPAVHGPFGCTGRGRGCRLLGLGLGLVGDDGVFGGLGGVDGEDGRGWARLGPEPGPDVGNEGVGLGD